MSHPTQSLDFHDDKSARRSNAAAELINPSWNGGPSIRSAATATVREVGTIGHNSKTRIVVILISLAATAVMWLTTVGTAFFTLSCSSVATPQLVTFTSQTIPIRQLFNNQAASHNGSSGSFSLTGSTYDATLMPNGSIKFDDVTYDLPTEWGTANDNVLALGQVISLPTTEFVHELHFLYSGDGNHTQTKYSFNLTFSDNTTQAVAVTGKGWWDMHDQNSGPLVFPYHFDAGGIINNNISVVQQWSTSLNSLSPLSSITLPNTPSGNRLHIFGMAYSSASSNPSPSVAVRRVRFTTNWEEVRGKRAQLVEVTLANLSPLSTSSSSTITFPLSVKLTGGGIKTLQKGTINRMMPSDQVRVEVLVIGGSSQSKATVEVMDDRSGKILGRSDGWTTGPLRTEWTEEFEVLESHETPLWWNKAKFGIFIHWGVYSVPAWGPPDVYAECEYASSLFNAGNVRNVILGYDWSMRKPPNTSSPTWKHHLETYGQDVLYDDFMANFTAASFNASAWLDLFENAGAKYFVLTTKHHDGFALFDTLNTTHRSSVYMGPKRDLVGELLTTAKREKPDMKRGTYYSLPEWFNPDYAKYGFGDWPGGLAINAFNQSTYDPFTGALPLGDYITDLQLPHMMMLTETYETDIMWCDIGGPNMGAKFAKQFFNQAWDQGRQVTINNRCGAPYDFDTPEYATFGSVQVRSWESSEGMDPHSYGLNNATNASQYMTPQKLITTLVDVVAHNGNFLLDVGPTADGVIIQPEVDNLLAAGEWLAAAGSCVYSTKYWFRTATEGNLRFLTTPETFCIVSLVEPINEQVIVNSTTPIVAGDEIHLLGAASIVGGLNWSVSSETGQLVINVPHESLDAVKYAWALEVRYKSVNS